MRAGGTHAADCQCFGNALCRWSVEVGEPELLAVKPANLRFVSAQQAARQEEGGVAGQVSYGD